MREQTQSPTWGKFGGDAFAEYLYQCEADEWEGDSTDGPCWIGRYGRHVLIEATDGRVTRASLGASDAGTEAHDAAWESLVADLLGDWLADDEPDDITAETWARSEGE